MISVLAFDRRHRGIRHFSEFLVFKLWHLDKTVGLGNGSTEIEKPQEDEEST